MGYNFNDLFVLDMANNHQGSVEHGLKIVKEVSGVAHKAGVRAAIKFQMRQLKSFIHPNYQGDHSNPMIQRFESTVIDVASFRVLKAAVEEHNLITMCTPFDEKSVEVICEEGFEIIKIASCSADDWPLIDCVAATGRPVIVSTGGLSLEQTDQVVTFLDHKGLDFALMHCVSVYPTPVNLYNLRLIEQYRSRYPGITIGWSTHEDPNELHAISIAHTLGARMFERHVGVESEGNKLNAYSSNPQQLEDWFTAYRHTVEALGSGERVLEPSESEALRKLKRGAYICRDVEEGEAITQDDLIYAIPLQNDQVTSGEVLEGTVAKRDLEAGNPLGKSDVLCPPTNATVYLKRAIHAAKAMINKSNTRLPRTFEVEFSHHYGIEQFSKTGALIIDVINREYCKKIIVLIPGQTHPNHFHKRKEETFVILHGTLSLTLDREQIRLGEGEMITIHPGVWHSFSSDTGCVFEEISTTHYNDDSYYTDPVIRNKSRCERKTKVSNWGRFSF